MIAKTSYPFQLPPLPYAYDALESYIDEETMHLHHDRHFQTYIDNLNKALEPYPVYHTWTLEKLLANLDHLPPSLRTAVREQGGGVYNHDLYFDTMIPGGKPMPQEIALAFGGEEPWKTEMKNAALGQFGSGFAWLVSDCSGKLSVVALPNQDNPLSIGLYPLLPLDVWEHAYYLKYHNLRGDYIDNWFRIINWDMVMAKLEERQRCRRKGFLAPAL